MEQSRDARSGTVPAAGARGVAIVGLGVMGSPMARRLLDAGYSVRVYNRSRGAVEQLVDRGAAGASSPAEAAEGAEMFITMLPDAATVAEVVRVADLAPETVWIDHSTIAPETARELADEVSRRGADALDAPVSGGEQGAIDGTLSIMVGGERTIFDRCRQLLEVLGDTITYVGPSGAGQVAKACNQIVVGVTIQAVAEALTLARRAGADPVAVRAALLGGFAASPILRLHGQRMLDRAYEPGGRVALHHKDLGIALDLGSQAHVPLPATALVQQLFTALQAQGLDGLDHAALALLAEQLSGGNS